MLTVSGFLFTIIAHKREENINKGGVKIKEGGEVMKQILSTSRSRLLPVLICILYMGLPSAQGAGAVTSGNTFLDNYGELDGTDNWAVFETAGFSQDIIDDFVSGTGSPSFDTGSTLIFIYQTANNGGGNKAIDTLRQFIGSSTYVTSWGYFANWGFTDAGNAVGIAENMGVDTWPDGGANMRYGGDPGFVHGTYVNPFSTTLSSDHIDWYFDPVLRPELDVSSLLVYTSPYSLWGPDKELFHEPGCTWVGGFDNPHPIPEPATLALLALGGLTTLRRGRLLR